MKPLAILLSLLALAACGADGEPVQPSTTASVTVSSSGVYANAGVAVSRGPFTVFLGL